jgi:cyclophilin family peptidyl-prolyl cis-trans isomerase
VDVGGDLRTRVWKAIFPRSFPLPLVVKLVPRTRILGAALIALVGFWTSGLQAGQTIARFSTVGGDFDVLLYDEAVPVTVRNFVNYAQSGRYNSTFIHRSTTYTNGIQVIQGGSFFLAPDRLPYQVPVDPPIVLEAGLPNLRGTIAMARTEDPDTATSGWFFNVTDNPGLNPAPWQDGYAVFGRVLGEGMDVVDAMAGVAVTNTTEWEPPLPWPELPLIDGSYLLMFYRVTTAPFRVAQARHDGSGFRLDWSGPSAATPVNVERTTNLASGPWTVVSSNNTNSTFTDTGAPAAGAFYRVVIP